MGFVHALKNGKGFTSARSLIETLESRQLLSTTLSTFAPAATATTPAVTVTTTTAATATVTGTVTDSTGAALAGARVRLMPTTVGELHGFDRHGLVATTDSDGNYTIDNVPTGEFKATARAEDHIQATSAAFSVAAGADTAPTLALTEITFGSVAGTVTDAAGVPLADARVRLLPAPSTSPGADTLLPEHEYFAQTDASGNYAFPKVIAGDYVIQAGDKGYVRTTSASFTVAAGVNTAPTVKLTAIVYGTVTGAVVDATGAPVANARVRLAPAPTSTATPSLASPGAGGEGGQPLFAVTDASGDYTIDHVVAGDYVATVHDGGFAKTASASFTVAAGTTTAPTVTLTALTFGAVTGTVTDTSDAPIANAFVVLTSTSVAPAPTDPTASALPGAGDAHPARYVVQTDSTGAYSLSHVLAGTYTATVYDTGHQTTTSASFTVTSATTTVPPIQLPALVFGTVTGTITDSTGKPLADAFVRLVPGAATMAGGMDWDRAILVARTDADGHYTISDVPTGTYTVVSRDRGFAKNTSASFTVAEGATTAPTVALTAETTPPTPGDPTPGGSPPGGPFGEMPIL